MINGKVNVLSILKELSDEEILEIYNFIIQKVKKD